MALGRTKNIKRIGEKYFNFQYFFSSCCIFCSVIGFAYGCDERELYYAGMVGITDPPRQGVAESIEIVQSAGVKVKMVTGDAFETARCIGI